MSQQEFFPPSRKLKGSRDTQPSQWSVESTRPRGSASSASDDAPKSEHPSAFEGEIPPYSYPAQDQPPFAQPYRESPPQQQRQARPGAGYQTYWGPQEQQHARAGTGYHPSQGQQRQQHWEVPWWARPQPNATRGIPGWMLVVGAIILVIPLIPLILMLIGLLLTGLVIIALVPLILIGGLLFVGLVVFILFLAGITSRGRGGGWRW